MPLVEAQAERVGEGLPEAQAVLEKLFRASLGEGETVPLPLAVPQALPVGLPEGV